MSRMTPEQVQAHLDKLCGKKPRISALSEREFQAEVMDIANQLGWRFYHTHDSIGSQAGFPDLVMVRKKRLIFAELKTESGKLSIQQGQWLADLEKTAAEVYLWRPSQMDEIIKVLKH
jgi:hypothetical protein